jgi:hypothetical protein
MTTEDTYLPQDLADLLDRVEREWAALLDSVESLTAEQMTRRDPGGWSIKDHLAHVTEWERFLIRNQFEGQTAHVALGIDPTLTEGPDEAGINAALQARNRDRSLPDVLADLGRTHDRVLAELETRSYADLQKRTRVMGPDERPMILWVIYNTYEHYLEHRQSIEAAKAR